MRRLCPLRYSLVLILLLGLVVPLHAHEPGLSAAALRLDGDVLTAHLTFSQRELARLSLGELETSARHLIDIRQDGQPLTAQTVSVQQDASDAVHVRLTFAWRSGAQLRVHAPILAELARGHRQYLSVHNAAGERIAHRVLDAGHAVFETTLHGPVSSAAARPSFSQFVHLGMEHIVMGYDHLLFLFALLVVGGSFWQAWRIITSFTIAHSITLALATLDWVHAPPSLVEPLIAVSIIYVGLENLYRRDLQRREWLTFGFGLIHGLGFASVLRELGIGSSGSETVMPLLAFNLGVELGQVGIVLILLPMMGSAQRLPRVFPRLATTCSILVMLTGAYWLYERLA